MRQWPAHAFVLTVLLASAILSGRIEDATILGPSVPSGAASAVDSVTPVVDPGLEARNTVVPEPAAESAGGFTSNVERWRDLSLATSDVVQDATGVSLDNDLLLALVAVESGGDPGARSRAGAVGLTQVEPATFGDLQKRYRQVLGSGSLEQPRTNLLAGGIYLAECARQLHADLANPSELDLVLKAYNLGPRAAAEWRATGVWLDQGEVEYALPIETIEHSARIVAAYRNARAFSPSALAPGQD